MKKQITTQRLTKNKVRIISYKVTFLLLVITGMLFVSCQSKKSVYSIEDINKQRSIHLQNWNYIGPLKFPDSASTYLDKDHLFKATGITESNFSKNPTFYSPVVKKGLLIEGGGAGYHQSEEPIVDFGWTGTSSRSSINAVKGSAIYLSSTLISDKEQKPFLLIRSAGIIVWLNGKKIYQTDDSKQFGQFISFGNFVRLTLKKGSNVLLIKMIVNEPAILFEAQLCSKEVAINEYQKILTGLILYNPIQLDRLYLEKNNVKDLDTSITYMISKSGGISYYPNIGQLYKCLN